MLPHSEKQDATETWKKNFGRPPLVAFVDHGQTRTGEPVAALLRPGDVADTAADHIETTQRWSPYSPLLHSTSTERR
ncbi:hypothetical protein SGFS_026240 [Streptomyces graminofaciens]|uniref:Transposase n=1 Tax=Streptomyces graminofaciens TaxID=68212 RepID=A0ABM7F416_9ACTN|nr:hypothetical protein SGFS_026240 [Streptomyces graminofaciens]